MYDYIVVGAGAAGCVVANRLSESPAVRVLVLEAGPMDSSPLVEMPVAYARMFKSRHDWDFATEYEPGLDGRPIYLAQGRLVGGSTSMNGMVYMRGSRTDYDGWAAAGAVGWSYEEVLPYFRRAEDNVRGADRFHGTGGPLSVAENNSRHPLAAAALKAAGEAGVAWNEDLNGASQAGVSWHQVMQRDGRRCSAAAGYLHPALERPNLDLLADTPALNLVTEGARVVGVDALRDGRVLRYRAEREVVVSCGTYQSAVLLMVSGIGPAGHLGSFGIEVVADLPVGQGIQDHLMTALVFTSDVTSLLDAFSPESLEQYAAGRGPLTSGSGEAGGHLRVLDDSPECDFQVSFIPALFDGWREVTAHGVSLAGWPSKPTSRGSIRLRAPDALTKPRILHNYLTTEHDRRCTAAGLRRLAEVAAQPALKAVITGVHAAPAGGSDEEVLAFARSHASTTWHPVAGCAIGSVVDPELRVFGVEGLRVADASVMPSVPRGNTTAPAIMIGEKVADLIAADLLAANPIKEAPA